MKASMKVLIRLVVILGVGIISLSACKSKRAASTPIEKSAGTIEISVPLSNKGYWRIRKISGPKARVIVIGEKLFQESNNTYTYWVAVEANKQTVLNLHLCFDNI